MNPRTGTTNPSPDPLQSMREEFRRHLEVFYATLKLAPPYHSVEKAIVHLTNRLKGLPAPERGRIAADSTLRWAEYRDAVIASGLNQKHRGIIAGFAKNRQELNLPPEYDSILDTFVT